MNHLTPLLLTLELLPTLLETAAASGNVRVVFVSSNAHRQAAPFNAENLVVKEEANYDRLKTYPNTKLYNVSSVTLLQCMTPSDLDPQKTCVLYSEAASLQ